MMHVMSDEEIKLGNERVRQLYMSEWTVDNLTAILLDTSVGSTGLYEDVARAKAHRIFSWLRTISQAGVPERRVKG